jgi:hypothetical protein
MGRRCIEPPGNCHKIFGSHSNPHFTSRPAALFQSSSFCEEKYELEWGSDIVSGRDGLVILIRGGLETGITLIQGKSLFQGFQEIHLANAEWLVMHCS